MLCLSNLLWNSTAPIRFFDTFFAAGIFFFTNFLKNRSLAKTRFDTCFCTHQKLAVAQGVKGGNNFWAFENGRVINLSNFFQLTSRRLTQLSQKVVNWWTFLDALSRPPILFCILFWFSFFSDFRTHRMVSGQNSTRSFTWCNCNFWCSKNFNLRGKPVEFFGLFFNWKSSTPTKLCLGRTRPALSRCTISFFDARRILVLFANYALTPQIMIFSWYRKSPIKRE